MKKLFTFLTILWLFLTGSAIAQDWDQSHYYNGSWYSFVDKSYSGLPTDYVTGLVFNGPDTVWVSGDWGLSVWTKIWTQIGEEKKLGWTHYNLPDIPPEGDRISHLVKFSNHQLLVATDYDADEYQIQINGMGSLWLLDITNMSWRKLLNRRVRDIVVENTPQRKIYTACDTCLIVFDPQNDFAFQSYKITDKYNSPDYLDKLRSLTFDSRNQLWIINSNVKEWSDQDPGYVIIWNTTTHNVEWQSYDLFCLDIVYDSIRDSIWVSGRNRVRKFSLNIPPTWDNYHVRIYNNKWDRITIDQFGFMWLADLEATGCWWNGIEDEGIAGVGGSPVAYANHNIYYVVPRPGTKQVWFAGSRGIPIFTYGDDTAVETEPETTPQKFELLQNYPNPFNSSTTIAFSLSKPQEVKLCVFNAIGQKIATLLNGELLPTGRHTYNFNAANLPTGIYFYQLTLPQSGIIKTGKMLLVR